MKSHHIIVLILFIAFINPFLIFSCGKKGPSLPPIVVLPGKVIDLKVRQIHDSIVLSFILPEKNTDGSIIQEKLSAIVLCFAQEAQENGSSTLFSSSEFLKRAKVCMTIPPDRLELADRKRVFLEDKIFKRYGKRAEGKEFFYAIQLENRKGKKSPLSEIISLVTIKPLISPINLKAIVLEECISLSWDYPLQKGLEGKEPHFNIYRMEAPAPHRSLKKGLSQKAETAFLGPSLPEEEKVPFLMTPINKKPISEKMFMDKTFDFGKDYLYIVRAVIDESQPYRESAPSNMVRICPQDHFPPQSPQGLVAVSEGPLIRLFWHPNTEKDLGGYRIYRESKPLKKFLLIGETPPHVTSYSDEGVTPGHLYRYYVTAFDTSASANESPPSSIVSESVRSPFGLYEPFEKKRDEASQEKN